MRRLAILVAFPLALAGCSSGAPQADPSVTMPTPAVTADPTGATSPGATPSGATPTVASPATSTVPIAPDPCEKLTNAEVSKAFGEDVTNNTTASQDGSKLCSYTVKTSGLRISALATPMVEDLDKLTPYITKQITDAKITPATIEGAEDARLVTGTINKVPAVDVIAVRKGVMYQVFTTWTGGDVKKMSQSATDAMTALLA